MNARDVEIDAKRAIAYGGYGMREAKGNVLAHKPSGYGLAIKWLIGVRGYTYSEFGRLYNGKDRQSLNYLLNRAKGDAFKDDDLDKVCGILRVKREYLDNLSSEIEKING